MKYFSLLLFVAATLFIGCGDDETQETGTLGTFTLNFENFASAESVELETEGSTNYPYTNALGQTFNITMLGYYISEIKLEGPNGELWEEEMLASVDESTGFYHILQSKEHSQTINLDGIPSGIYNKLTFKLGIESYGVTEGASGGVLDVANGAWFWNWNNGYIAFALEGQSPDSPGEAGASSLAADNPHSMAFHMGGWGEINNNREIVIEFGQHVHVEETASPFAHIGVDILNYFTGSEDVDFSATNSIHSPTAGQVLANNISDAFYLHHLLHDQEDEHSHD